jgi:hypothetical protein
MNWPYKIIDVKEVTGGIPRYILVMADDETPQQAQWYEISPRGFVKWVVVREDEALGEIAKAEGQEKPVATTQSILDVMHKITEAVSDYLNNRHIWRTLR